MSWKACVIGIMVWPKQCHCAVNHCTLPFNRHSASPLLVTQCLAVTVFFFFLFSSSIMLPCQECCISEIIQFVTLGTGFLWTYTSFQPAGCCLHQYFSPVNPWAPVPVLDGSVSVATCSLKDDIWVVSRFWRWQIQSLQTSTYWFVWTKFLSLWDKYLWLGDYGQEYRACLILYFCLNAKSDLEFIFVFLCCPSWRMLANLWNGAVDLQKRGMTMLPYPWSYLDWTIVKTAGSVLKMYRLGLSTSQSIVSFLLSTHGFL